MTVNVRGLPHACVLAHVLTLTVAILQQVMVAYCLGVKTYEYDISGFFLKASGQYTFVCLAKLSVRIILHLMLFTEKWVGCF